MRIDKFLWHVRFYKTRSLATDAAKKNRFLINDEVVKPSREVLPSDIIKIKKQGITFKIEVLQIPKSRIGAKLKTLYIKDLTSSQEYEKLKEIQKTQSYYRYKGIGRPTKKDRRDIEDFTIDFDTEDET